MSDKNSKLCKQLDKYLCDLNVRESNKIYVELLSASDTEKDIESVLQEYFERISSVIDTDSRMPRKEIKEFWDVSRKAYESVGSQKRSYAQAYFNYLQRTGNCEKAKDKQSKWMTKKRDALSNSRVTEELDRFRYYCMVKDYSNAFFVLDEIIKTCKYEKYDKMKYYIQPLRYKLLLGMKDEVKRDLSLVYKRIKLTDDNKIYITEVLKVMAVLYPKRALSGLYFLKNSKVQSNDKIKFDMGIIAEIVRLQLSKSLNPRVLTMLDQIIEDGYEVQKVMNARNRSVVYTEEILFWRKIINEHRELPKKTQIKD